MAKMTERAIRRRIAKVEAQMDRQIQQGMETGWPVLYWDRNCVEREVLRRVLGLRRKPYCPADVMAGL